MPANVETMFFVGRKAPWHGLGTSVQGALTSEEAIIHAGLDWNVEKAPIYLGDDTSVPGYCATVRSSDQKVLGIVSPHYQIVQNSDAFSFVDNLLGEGVTYETAGSLRGGRSIWVLAKMPETYQILGDDYDPYLVLTNSHDGSGAVRVCITPIRVVCQNTLNLALNTAKRKWVTTHKGNMESKILDARHSLEFSRHYMVKLEDSFNSLHSVKLSDKKVIECVKSLLPIPADAGSTTVKAIKKDREELLLRYREAPDLQSVDKTAYRFVNAVSDYVTHKSPRRNSPNYQENRFISILDGGTLLDKANSLMNTMI